MMHSPKRLHCTAHVLYIFKYSFLFGSNGSTQCKHVATSKDDAKVGIESTPVVVGCGISSYNGSHALVVCNAVRYGL